METLNEQQITELRALLVERDRALRADIQRELNLQDDYVQLASEVPDPGDLSFANLSIDLGNAAVTRDMTELRAVELALKKMNGGAFGECLECGYPIPYARLLAMPTAERCAPCQENHERTHQDGPRGASL